MKKIILSMAIAAVALVGCDVKDNTPTVFQYQEYGYYVSIAEDTKPAGLLAFDVTYVDADGQLKKETITKTWTYKVPAKKDFVMKMTVKMVLAPGTARPTSGNEVKLSGSYGIVGVQTDGTVKLIQGDLYQSQLQSTDAYKLFNKELDNAKVKEYESVIKPILEPGM